MTTRQRGLGSQTGLDGLALNVGASTIAAPKHDPYRTTTDTNEVSLEHSNGRAEEDNSETLGAVPISGTGSPTTKIPAIAQSPPPVPEPPIGATTATPLPDRNLGGRPRTNKKLLTGNVSADLYRFTEQAWRQSHDERGEPVFRDRGDFLEAVLGTFQAHPSVFAALNPKLRHVSDRPE
jgi:hypothetical protein